MRFEDMKIDLDTRDLEMLTPEFEPKVRALIKECGARGVAVKPFFTTRGPATQARMWRQSRADTELEKVSQQLKKQAPFLMEILENTPQVNGRWATNLLPGQSWHQWGEACDLYVLNTMGQVVWSSQHPGYGVMATVAEELGLTSGHPWPNKDSVHIQLRSLSVRDIYNWTEIDEKMRSLFRV